jgi:endonuclease-8
MPEGHTIHRIAQEHRACFAGSTVAVTSPQGRFLDAPRLDGRRLKDVDAWGKHLLYEFEGRRYVQVHLGLFGRVRTASQPAPSAGPTVRMRLAANDWYADLIGPTRCRLLDGDQRTELVARLGPDPLRADAQPDLAWRRLSVSSQPIAALLMDQSVVAGIGNVYRAELLFRAGLDPYRQGRSMTPELWDGLWGDARTLLRAGARSGRILTTKPEDRRRAVGRVRDDDAHYVYGRSGRACRRCGAVVRSAPLAGRTLYWCPACQPPR